MSFSFRCNSDSCPLKFFYRLLVILGFHDSHDLDGLAVYPMNCPKYIIWSHQFLSCSRVPPPARSSAKALSLTSMTDNAKISGISPRPYTYIADGSPSSSVHGFSASYVALRNKGEISPVVEYSTLESSLQEIIQFLCTFTCNNEANLSPISLAFRRLKVQRSWMISCNNDSSVKYSTTDEISALFLWAT